MLLGRSLRDVVILLFQALIMIVLAIPFGLHIDLAGVAVTLGLLALIGLVRGAAVVRGGADPQERGRVRAARPGHRDAAAAAVGDPAADGARARLAAVPQHVNPLTHAADAARALFNSDWGNPEIAIGVLITAALAAFAVWIASRTFSRANA